MKKIMMLLGVFCLTQACKRERAELGPPPSKIIGIQDDWTLDKVIQIDEITLKELDVSTAYLGNSPTQINFKISGTDTIYSVIAGSSANYLGSSGKWRFDDNDYPKKLIITHDGNDYHLPLLRTIREGDPTLEFKYTKVCRGKNVVGYKYIFKRT